MAEPDIQRYLDGIEAQHRTKEKFMTQLAGILDMIDGAHACAVDMPRAFYVHEAVGKQLDTVALYIGGDRRFPPVPIPGLPSLLSDDIFRKVLLAKIVQNRWDGTEATFQEIWNATFRDEIDATYYDNQDMTMDVNVNGYTEPIMTELILAGYIIPKPMGVGLNVEITERVIADENASFKPTFSSRHTANCAKIGLHYPFAPAVEAGEEIATGSKAYSNSGRIRLLIFQGEQQDEDSAGMGERFFANSARIRIPVTI